jgi:hypothetical protein
LSNFLLPFIDIVHFFPFNYGFVHIDIIEFKGLIKRIPNGFTSNFTIFIIPRVGRSIIIFIGHLERELVNRSGKGSCKIMIEFFNVVLIS